MMREQELDRVIDAAAAQLVGREPTRTLTEAVMSRVRQGGERRPVRLVWAAATGVLVCVAIAAAVLSRDPEPMPIVPSTSLFGIQPPPIMPPLIENELLSARGVGSARASRLAGPRSVSMSAGVSPIEALQTEPITVPAIEVGHLGIEPITVEPLAASND